MKHPILLFILMIYEKHGRQNVCSNRLGAKITHSHDNIGDYTEHSMASNAFSSCQDVENLGGHVKNIGFKRGG